MAELLKTNFFRMLPYLMPLLIAYFSGRYLCCRTNENTDKSTTSLLAFIKRPLFIALLGWILLGSLSAWLLVLLVFLSFMIVDWLLAKFSKYSWETFLLDLTMHILLLAGFSTLIVLNQNLHFTIFWYAIFGKTYFIVMIALIGFFFAVPIGGEIIGFLIEPFHKQLEAAKAPIATMDQDETPASANTTQEVTTISEKSSLQTGNQENSVKIPVERGFPKGGKIIGELERSLIFLFILANQPAGIGFLLATKVLFRFGDLKNKDLKESEYYFIGTLYSFFYGILFAYFTKYLLSFF
jgi:hypothetical protein